MTDYLVRATLRSANNAPKDDVQNAFAVFHNGPITDFDEVADHFANFYVQDTTSGAAAGEYLNASIARTQGLMIELVESPGVVPNAPAFTKLYDLPAAADTDSLPQEVSVCVSFVDNVYLTTTQPGRHRGRIYFGPLVINALQTVTGSYARPSAEIVTVLMQAAAELRDGATFDGAWSIWSRANAALYAVDGGWVDNEFDTQRRRGHVSTVRNIW